MLQKITNKYMEVAEVTHLLCRTIKRPPNERTEHNLLYKIIDKHNLDE